MDEVDKQIKSILDDAHLCDQKIYELEMFLATRWGNANHLYFLLCCSSIEKEISDKCFIKNNDKFIINEKLGNIPVNGRNKIIFNVTRDATVSETSKCLSEYINSLPSQIQVSFENLIDENWIKEHPEILSNKTRIDNILTVKLLKKSLDEKKPLLKNIQKFFEKESKDLINEYRYVVGLPVNEELNIDDRFKCYKHSFFGEELKKIDARRKVIIDNFFSEKDKNLCEIINTFMGYEKILLLRQIIGVEDMIQFLPEGLIKLPSVSLPPNCI